MNNIKVKVNVIISHILYAYKTLMGSFGYFIEMIFDEAQRVSNCTNGITKAIKGFPAVMKKVPKDKKKTAKAKVYIGIGTIFSAKSNCDLLDVKSFIIKSGFEIINGINIIRNMVVIKNTNDNDINILR